MKEKCKMFSEDIIGFNFNWCVGEVFFKKCDNEVEI